MLYAKSHFFNNDKEIIQKKFIYSIKGDDI